jgi:hypothetical protein
MRLFHHITVFAMGAMTLVVTAGGCSRIKEAIDCDEMCTQIEACVDSSLNVDRCNEMCGAKVHDNPLRDSLDECTDCLEENYACGEVAEMCPVCDDVTKQLLD